MIRFIFNITFLENKQVLFVISCILITLMIIIPFIIAYKIINKKNS